MNDSKISVRYAKALFQLGQEKDILNPLRTDMSLVKECCETVADFWLMLESPVVKTSKKQMVVKQIFSSKVNEITLNFLDLVVRNKREVFLKDICRNFLSLCRKNMGIQSAVLTSAVALEPKASENMLELIQKTFNTRVELEQRVDPNLIGGFVLRVEDQQLDASVSRQLSRIKRELLTEKQFGNI